MPIRRLLLILACPAIVGLLSLPTYGADPPATADELESARVLLQKGRYDEAIEAYEKLAAAKDDKSARIAVSLSEAYLAEGNWERAAEVLEQAAKQAPKDADVWAALAELQFQRGAYDAAEKSCGEVLRLAPEHLRARLVQADLFTETGRIEQADEAYAWFVRYYNRVQPEDAPTLLLVGRGSLQYARWHSVSGIFNFLVNTLCEDAVKADALSWQALHFSGSLLLEKYNRGQALPEFRKALAMNPRAADVLAALGLAALQQHDLKEAEQYADQALVVNPRLVAALHVKADVKLALGGTADALELLTAALAVNPLDQTTLARVAACYLLDDGAPSENVLNELLANVDAIDQVKVADPDRFSNLVMELARRNPKPGRFLAVLGTALESRRQLQLAEQFYRQATRVMPQLSESKTQLAMLCMHMGKIDEARTLLQEAFDADRFHVRVNNMKKVLEVLDGYDDITTEHFVIRVDSKADKLLGRYMAEYLEQEYDGLVKQFGFEPPQRSQFEIYHNAKGLSAHQWFSARMVGLPWIQTIGASTGMIVALASPTAAPKPYNWARVVKHEFVHVVTLQQTRFRIPHWFTEALAVTSEGYPRPAIWDKLLLERVPQGNLHTLDTLSQAFVRPESPLDWQFAYCQSQLYAEFMIKQYGPETIAKLLDAYRDNVPTGRAIQQVFGVDQATFEQGYREYLTQIVAELHSTAWEPAQPIAELEKAHRAKSDDPRVAAEYAYALLKARRRTQARELAAAALEKDARQPLAAVVLAELELASGNASAAADVLAKVLDRDAPHPRVLQLLAAARLKQERFDEAQDLLELGRLKFPNDTEFLKGLSVVYSRKGNNAQLPEILDELARRDFDDAAPRKKLAEITLTEKRFAEAADHALSAIHIDVRDPDLHRMLGEAWAAQDLHAKAVREFEVAAELKPDSVELAFALAQAHVAAGQPDQARLRLQALLKQHSDHAPSQELLKRLP